MTGWAACKQEFLGLVRTERLLDALAYACAHMVLWAGAHLPELSRLHPLL